MKNELMSKVEDDVFVRGVPFSSKRFMSSSSNKEIFLTTKLPIDDSAFVYRAFS